MINIRDTFIYRENGVNYMIGTRGKNFGIKVGGFDVYTSRTLDGWSDPVAVFDSARYGLNEGANWAPELRKYRGRYYIFATFVKPDGLRGTYSLVSDSPTGPFEPTGDPSLTPDGWECLDGTLYVEDGVPYLVFCHEHTQIVDGTICFVRLNDELSAAAGEPVTLFSASEPYYVDRKPEGEHYVTDGPFMYRFDDGLLLMIWSTFLNGKYAVCQVRFTDGTIKGAFEHLDPVVNDDGGHGMLFDLDGRLILSVHSPNTSGQERPRFIPVRRVADALVPDES